MGTSYTTTNSYTIEECRRGIIVKGSIPVMEMAALTQVWMDRGWDLVDAKLSSHLGVTMVVTNKKNSVIWRQDAGIEKCAHSWVPSKMQGYPMVCALCERSYQ